MIIAANPPGHEGLSGDAWAALIGAVIGAAAAIWVSVWQRRGEKRDKKNEAAERRKALCTALLYEIDRFYSVYIDRFLKIVDASTEKNEHPRIESPGMSPFPVYVANCGHIGEMDRELVQTIVDFYAGAQRHALRLEEYGHKYEVAAQTQGGSGASVVDEVLLQGIKSACETLVLRAYIVCAYLCEYTGIAFKAGQFQVARGEGMKPAELGTAQTAIENFRARMKRDRG